MTETVTHIAGVPITVCGRVIQRCSLCGEKLVDSKNCAMLLEEDGSTPIMPTWEVGRLVQVSVGENPARYLLLPDTDRIPKDSCLELVE